MNTKSIYERRKHVKDFLLTPLFYVMICRDTSMSSNPETAYKMARKLAGDLLESIPDTDISNINEYIFSENLSWLRLHEYRTDKNDFQIGANAPTVIVPSKNKIDQPTSILVTPVNNGKLLLDTSLCLGNCLAGRTPDYLPTNTSKPTLPFLLLCINTTALQNLTPINLNTLSEIELKTIASKWVESKPLHNKKNISLASIHYPTWKVQEHYSYGFPRESERKQNQPEICHQQALDTYLTHYNNRINIFKGLNHAYTGSYLGRLSKHCWCMGFNIEDPLQYEHFLRHISLCLPRNLRGNANQPQEMLEILGIRHRIAEEIKDSYLSR